jgi:hypothetical protein
MTNADYVAALEAIPKVRAEPKEHAFRPLRCGLNCLAKSS